MLELIIGLLSGFALGMSICVIVFSRREAGTE